MKGKTSGESADWSKNALLENIAKNLRHNFPNLKVKGHGLSFTVLGGKTKVSVKPLKIKSTSDSEVTHVVTIKSEFPGDLSSKTEEQVVGLNSLAGMSAFVKDPKSRNLVSVSCLNVRKGCHASWNHYGRVIGCAAILQFETMMQLIVRLEGKSCPPINLPQSEDSSRWDEKEFKNADMALSILGFHSSCWAGRLSVEFPWQWEAGNVTATVGRKTSVLDFFSDMPHPVLGSGLFYKLELPVGFDHVELSKVANILNLYEISNKQSPPFFGGWGDDPNTHNLAYFGFWPNVLYLKNDTFAIASWMIIRSNIARKVLFNSSLFTPIRVSYGSLQDVMV